MALSKSQKSLRDWTSQNWMTSDTYSNKKSGSSKEVKSEGRRRYLPESAWSSLSSGEKAATNRAKAEGNKKGKQHVSQPESVKKKTKKHR